MTPDIESSFKSFKQRKTFATRKDEVAGIREKFPTKIPVVVERYQKESYLPQLDKMKFLVPQELTMSQFVTIIRNRLLLAASQAFYLLVSNRSLASLSKTMGEIYRENRDDDGFLYITYASQEMFGSLQITKDIWTNNIYADICPRSSEKGLFPSSRSHQLHSPSSLPSTRSTANIASNPL